MALAVEIEYLCATSFSADASAPSRPEWPPHPDRLFMAMVAAWGRRPDGACAGALRWLERQPPPDIHAPPAHERDAHVSYVPVSGNAEQARDAARAAPYGGARRKARRFPAMALPDADPRVWMVWESDPPPWVRGALSSLASRVPRLGHSASLVRVSVAPPGAGPPGPATYVRDEAGRTFLRCPEVGRLAALESWFAAAAGSGERRPPAAPARRYSSAAPGAPAGEMAGGAEWIILSCSGGTAPDLEAFPVVAKRMRDAVMSHAEGRISAEISGHEADGAPLRGPHLAILPMADVGWEHSDGGLMGIALVMPRRSAYPAPERRQLRRAVSAFLGAGSSPGTGDLAVGASCVMGLAMHRGGGARSLGVGRYAGAGRLWASATPVVLDRHPKRSKPAEDVIADSCVRCGLPRPARVETSRHSQVRAAPPAYAAGRGRGGWQPPRPGMLDGRYVCHAAIDFGRDVEGPVVLGAGRHYGLGLFMRRG